MPRLARYVTQPHGQAQESAEILSISHITAPGTETRQPEERHQEGVPLRAGIYFDLRGYGASL
jgi:hypothetical protein